MSFTTIYQYPRCNHFGTLGFDVGNRPGRIVGLTIMSVSCDFFREDSRVNPSFVPNICLGIFQQKPLYVPPTAVLTSYCGMVFAHPTLPLEYPRRPHRTLKSKTINRQESLRKLSVERQKLSGCPFSNIYRQRISSDNVSSQSQYS